MRNRFMTLFVAVLALAVMFEGAAIGEEASEADVFDPDIGEPPVIMTEAEAVELQAAFMAAEFDMSVEVVKGQFAYERSAEQLIVKVSEETDSRVYSGAALDFYNPGTLTLYFKGSIPKNAHEVVADSGLSGVTLVGGRNYSESQLVELGKAVFSEIRNLGYEQVGVAVDVRSEQILARVVDTPTHVFATSLNLTETVEAAILDLKPGVLMVHVLPVGESLHHTTHGYGGSWMRDDAIRECSSGFVVRRSSDWKEGVLTASHCEGINTLEQHNSSQSPDPVTSFSAPWAGEMFVPPPAQALGDVEFHTTTHDDYPLFWWTWSALLSPSSSASNGNHTVGKSLSAFGRRTGPRSGVILSSSYTATIPWEHCGASSGPVCFVDVLDMVAVDRPCQESECQAKPGDSGGPWFKGTVAYGIQSSYDVGWPGQPGLGYFELYTKIHHAENYFGVFVQTG